MHANGQQQKQMPTAHVAWDAETQQVRLAFDPAQFKSWEFVAMVLGAAQKQAEFSLNLGRARQAALLQAEDAEAQALAKQLKLG